MNSSDTCPSCGSPLPKGTAPCQCPACLLKAGMAGDLLFGGGAKCPDTEAGPLIASVAAREAPGTMIGRYRLLKEIGEGGFGIVYMAEQTEPVKRRVALKVIKPGMDTWEVVARFESERQALAMMDHPNIARIFDGGATDSGRPFFVMELVQGIPLTSYCDGKQLTTRERLELFLDVLSAVQHAHQKGVIHRDLKPSNILISLEDGRPLVKVIDFGIAKALSSDQAQQTHFTGFGQMIGTPQYASPEQAETSVLDADTRSDIYSLGVVLYEVLTGRTPLDRRQLHSASMVEVQRLIREVEPPRPSAAVTAMNAEELAKMTRHRRTDPAGLISQLQGDLDWIVLKALEKDRTRRYETATGFARDIRRFLDDEPVSATPPSMRYRLGKFARRHRVGVVWTAVVSSLVLAAAVGMSILYFQAEMERKKAVEVKQLARDRTWRALASEVDGFLASKAFGRRARTFAALKEAISFPEAMQVPENRKRLQDAAIAALAMVDVQVAESWEGNPGLGDMLASSPDLKSCASTYPNGRIEIRSHPSRALLAELPGAGDPVKWVLRYSPEGNLLAAGYEEPNGAMRVKIWNVVTGAPPVDVGLVRRKAFAFFPDSSRCAVGRIAASGPVLDILQVSTAEPVSQMALAAQPHSVSVSSDGRLVAVSFDEANRVDIHEVASGKLTASLAVPRPAAMAFAPLDNSLAVCSGSAEHEIFLWTAGRWTEPALLLKEHWGTPDAVAWSPDGRFLASTGWDDTIRLWDPFQGIELCWCDGRASALTFSADGRRLGFLRDGRTVRMLEVEPGGVCYRGAGHRGNVGTHAGAWNAAGTLMASCGQDGVSLWNREGRRLASLDVQDARGLAFFQNSLFVASRAGLSRWPLGPAAGDVNHVMVLQKPEWIGAYANCEQLALCTEVPPSPGISNFQPRYAKLALIDKINGAGKATLYLIDLLSGYHHTVAGTFPNAAFCSLSADGRWLAAGTWKGSGVRVWSLANPSAPPLNLEVPGSASVAFSPGDRWLVSGDTEAYRFLESRLMAVRIHFADRRHGGILRPHGLQPANPRCRDRLPQG